MHVLLLCAKIFTTFFEILCACVCERAGIPPFGSALYIYTLINNIILFLNQKNGPNKVQRPHLDLLHESAKYTRY